VARQQVKHLDGMKTNHDSKHFCTITVLWTAIGVLCKLGGTK